MADVMLPFCADFSKKSERRKFEKITIGSIFADDYAAVRYADRLRRGKRKCGWRWRRTEMCIRDSPYSPRFLPDAGGGSCHDTVSGLYEETAA